MQKNKAVVKNSLSIITGDTYPCKFFQLYSRSEICSASKAIWAWISGHNKLAMTNSHDFRSIWHCLLVFPCEVGEASLKKREVGVDLLKLLKLDWLTRSSSCANNLNSYWWLVHFRKSWIGRIDNNGGHFHTLGWWGSNNSETCLKFGIVSCSNNLNLLCVI